MKFPCENCIVDVMCINPCSDLRIYLSKVTRIDTDNTNTSARLKRLHNIAVSNPEYFRHYANLYMNYRHKGGKKNEISM